MSPILRKKRSFVFSQMYDTYHISLKPVNLWQKIR